MSPILDPAKLKVVELRAELSTRGLDTKGNKAVLVKRLKDALEEELEKEIPDTSIADTSTEDLDVSITKPEPDKSCNAVTDTKEPPPQPVQDAEPAEVAPVEKVEQMETDAIEEVEKVEVDKKLEEEDKVVIQEVTETEITKIDVQADKPESNDDKLEESLKEEVIAENGDTEQQDQDQEPKNRKSRWGTVPTESNTESVKSDESNEHEGKKSDENADTNVVEQRGDKRKRSSASPERVQRRRSKSPVKEDEPPIDSDKVQLSWYDCDLHLQIDKDSFLSAHPYHDGAFGYIWSGVRVTHGVNTGKVCYEVKITEELKWEDIVKAHDRLRKEKHAERSKRSEDSAPKNKSQTNNDKNENEHEISDGTDAKPSADNNETNKAETEQGDVEMKETNEDHKETNDEEMKSDNNAEVGDKPENQETEEAKEPEPEPVPSHLFRVGWSLANTSLQLGEDKNSYAYESSGKFVTDKQFYDYGVQFGVGDVIGSYINIGTDEVSITYTVNGALQPVATKILRVDLPDDCVFFPHVLSRNFSFELNVGAKEEPWFPHATTLSDYVFIENAEEKVAGPVRVEKRSDCEVIMMCGLPASGKTHWVREHVKENPDKNYTVIGLDQLLERMTVEGNPLKSHYKKSWNIIMDKLQKCLNKLVELAALRRRNFIIDQTNIFPSAQRRKMRPFEGFKRRAVVVVVGDEEQAKRQALQEAQDGKDVPDNIVVLEMKGNMHIPRVNDCFEEVSFVELSEEESKAMVQKYIQQGRDAGFGPIPNVQRKDNRDDRSHRWHNRRNDNRSNYRERNYYRYEHQRPSWHNRSGGWNRNDRRDTRGPPAPRDWRNNRGANNRPEGRSGNRDRSQGNNYNRNRNQQPRSQQNWQGQGNWNQGQGNWNQGWHQGQGWNQQQQSSWGSGGQGQWKYGQQQSYAQGYGNYPNWNYYGQYAQNWSNAPQSQTSQAGQGTGQAAAAATTGSSSTQYGQYAQQAAWAQYAQQYAQGQNPSETVQPAQK